MDNAVSQNSDSKMVTCPFLYEVDIENELLFFVYYGGTSTFSYYLKTYDFKEDNNLLKVYQYGGYYQTVIN